MATQRSVLALQSTVILYKSREVRWSLKKKRGEKEEQKRWGDSYAIQDSETPQ